MAIALNIFAMRRSGQHGIINWILAQTEDNYSIHLDDCVFNENQNKVKFATNYKELTKEQFQNLSQPLILCNCEDQLVTDFSDWFPGNAIYTKSVILRDPYNLIASRLKASEYGIRRFGADLDIWKNHAKRALDTDIFLIKYNDWFMSKDYRRSISETLGIEFTDIGLEKINSGKSSFDGKHFNGKAQQMKVLERFKQLSHNYWDLFDNEVKELCIEHFNFHINNYTKEVIPCNNKNGLSPY